VLAFVLARGPHLALLPSNVASVQTASDAVPEDPGGLDPDFIPLPNVTDTGATSDPDLVRVEMPRSALAALGVTLASEGDGGTVEAEVALGADGVVRSVRLLQ
jgi:hypothetical protein